MKQLFKRSTAWLLCLALLMGLFAGVPGALITKASAEETTDTTEPAAEATNLLADYNASFEDYEIPNWTIETGVSQSRDKAADGNAWSLKISIKDAAATSDAIAVHANRTYNASVEVLGAGKLTIIFYDAEGAQVGEASAESVSSTEWQTLTVEDAMAPATAATAAVKLSSTTDDAVYFDNVALASSRHNSVSDTAATIINYDYETGDLTGWKGGAVVAEEDGNYANQVTTTTTGFQNVWTNRFEVTPGLNYVASIDIQAPTETYVQLYVYGYADNDSEYTATNALGTYMRLSYTTTAVGEYETVAARVCLPTDAKYACIRVLVKSNTDAAGTVLLDNAKFVPNNSWYNGSYEIGGTTTIGLPMGVWLSSENASYVGEYLNTDAVNARTGDQSLCVSNGQTFRNFDMNVLPGEAYTSSFWFKPADLAGWEGYLINRIRFYDANRAEITAATVAVTGVPSETDEWTYIENTAIAPEDACYARTEIVSSTSKGAVDQKVIYVDDAAFTPATPNLMADANCDFETANVSDESVIPQWVVQSGSAENTEVVYADAEHGYVAHISGTGAQVWLASQRFAAIPGEKYTASASFSGTAGYAQMYVRFASTATSTGAIKAPESKGQAETSYFTAESTGWVTVNDSNDYIKDGKITLTVPKNANYVYILFVGIPNSYKDTETDKNVYTDLDIYIDDVSLVKAADHSYTATVTEPTCTDSGYTTHTCLCGDSYKTDEVAALGHSYTSEQTKAPTCTEAGELTYTCSGCGNTYTEEIAALGHTEVTDEAVAPDCDNTGLTEGKHCSVCGEVFVAQEEVAANGHSYTSEQTKDPTCTEAGELTYTCSACGDTYTEEVAALGHTEVIDAAVDATCTATGLTEGKHCSVCSEVLIAQVETPVLGHSYASEVTTEPTLNTEGVRTYTCSTCGDSYTESIPVLTGAVAEVDSFKYASADEAIANAVSGQTVTLLADASITADAALAAGVTYVIPAGRVLTVAEGVTVTADAAATLNCAGTIVVAGKADISALNYGTTFGAMGGKLTIKSTGVVVMLASWENIWTPANDAQLGSMLVACEDGAYVEVGTQKWELATGTWAHLNHVYTSEQTKDPTCTEAGELTYTCSACGDSYTEEVAALGHTVVTDDAMDPSCTVNGLTEGSHCDVCGEVFVAQEEIPAIGHNYSSEQTKDPACGVAGEMTYTCANCGDIYKDEIPALEHSFTSVTVAPTCMTAGYTTHTCGTCGYTYNDNEIAATGHTWTDDADTTCDSGCGLIREIAAEENLLADYNPSFEKYELPEWSITEGVTQAKMTDAEGNVSWALKMNFKGAAAISSDAPALPDYPYFATAKIKGAGEMIVAFYDADGKLLSRRSVSADTADWQEIAINDITAPDNAVTAKVVLVSASDADVYFDNVRLTSGAYYVAVDVINGDFETGDETGWACLHNTKHEHGVVDMGDGNHAYYITTDNSKFGFKSASFAVLPDMAYVASMRVMVPTEAFLQFYVEYFENPEDFSSSTRISADYRILGDIEAGEWTEIAEELVIPHNAKYARFYVLTGRESTGTFYFDDAKVFLNDNLYNGSYEAADTNIGLPMGIKMSSENETTAGEYLNTNPVYALDGKNSLHTINEMWLNSYYMNIHPGETYTSTIHVMTDDVATWAEPVYVTPEEGEPYTRDSYLLSRIYYLDKDLQVLSMHDVKVLPTAEWTEVVNTAKAPVGAIYARTMILSQDGKSCYVDSATFEKAPDSNLIDNGKFEEKATGYFVAMPDWNCGTNVLNYTNVEFENGKGYVAHFFDEVYVGRQIASQTLTAKPGAKYTLTMEIKGEPSSEWIQMYIKFYGADGSEILSPEAVLSRGYVQLSGDKGELNGEWRTVTLTLTAPAGTVTMRALLSIAGQYTYDENKASVPQDAYDVTVNNAVLVQSQLHTHNPVVTDPTCTEQGYTTMVCACGDSYVDENSYVDALGHTEAEAVVENEVAPDCTNTGSYDSVVYCSVCGEELSRVTENVAALGHTEAEAVVENEVAADCTNTGSYDTVVYCSVCGEELSRVTETVAALGHTEVVDAAVAATCTATGLTEGKHCSVCNEVLVAQEEIAALGHSYTSEQTKAPSCTDAGELTYTCSACGDTYTEEIAALGHTEAEAIMENEVAPDCTNTGSYDTVVYCSVCGEELSRVTETVAALGHTEAEAVTENEVAPDCTNTGSYDTVVYCSVCGEELSRVTETVAALGHTEVTDDAVAATCTATGLTEGKHCSVCNEVLVAQEEIAALGHSYTSEQTKAPSCTDAGELTYTCSACGDTYTEEIAATGHTHGEQTNCEVAVNCSICGTEIYAAKDHTYDDNKDADCNICGAVREIAPDLGEDLIHYGSLGLSFPDYIGIQFLMNDLVIERYDKVYVVAIQQTPSGDVESTIEGIPYADGYTLFEQPIVSWSMTEIVTLTIYGEKDGVTYEGEQFVTSVELLALEKLAAYNEAGNTKACTALVDMLNYGAAVQVAYDYNATSLPTDDLGDYAAMGTTTTPTMEAENSIEGEGSVKVYLHSISMQSKIEFQLMVKGDASAYGARATVGDEDAEVFLTTLGSYTVIHVSVKAANMRDVFTIALYDADGNAVTQVYNVSVEAYAKTHLGSSKHDVVIAMMRFGDSIRAL